MMRVMAAIALGVLATVPSARRTNVVAGSVTGTMMAGSVTGTITYTGTPPKMKPIDMAKEPSCAKQHATPVMTENVTTGPDSSLQYVVVYISEGDTAAPPPSETV